MEWLKKCAMNIATCGKFSSDRTISEYAKDIWGVKPNEFKLPAPSEPVLSDTNVPEQPKAAPQKK